MESGVVSIETGVGIKREECGEDLRGNKDHRRPEPDCGGENSPSLLNHSTYPETEGHDYNAVCEHHFVELKQLVCCRQKGKRDEKNEKMKKPENTTSHSAQGNKLYEVIQWIAEE